MPTKPDQFQGGNSDLRGKLNELSRSIGAAMNVRSGRGINTRFSPRSGFLVSNTHAQGYRQIVPRVGIATVTDFIADSEGYYRGKLKKGKIDPNGDDIEGGDFGTDSDDVNVIIANIPEIADGAGLKADGSEVVVGFIIGTNGTAIPSGGMEPSGSTETHVGNDSDRGLPLMEVMAYPSAIQFIDVSKDGGSAGDGSSKCSFTYNWTDPYNQNHTADYGTVDTRPDLGELNPATWGIIRFNKDADDDTDWELMLVFESQSAEECSDSGGGDDDDDGGGEM